LGPTETPSFQSLLPAGQLRHCTRAPSFDNTLSSRGNSSLASWFSGSRRQQSPPAPSQGVSTPHSHLLPQHIHRVAYIPTPKPEVCCNRYVSGSSDGPGEVLPGIPHHVQVVSLDLGLHVALSFSSLREALPFSPIQFEGIILRSLELGPRVLGPHGQSGNRIRSTPLTASLLESSSEIACWK